jgi:hypothetical protein
MWYSRYFSSQFSSNAKFRKVFTRTVSAQRTTKLRGRKDDKHKNHGDPTGT